MLGIFRKLAGKARYCSDDLRYLQDRIASFDEHLHLVDPEHLGYQLQVLFLLGLLVDSDLDHLSEL